MAVVMQILVLEWGKLTKAFSEIPQLLVSNIDLEIRKKPIRTYIWGMVFYGRRIWTINK